MHDPEDMRDTDVKEIGKENQPANEALLETNLETYERRRKEKVEAAEAKIEADLSQERMLEKDMKLLRARISGEVVYVERLKGLISFEDQIEETDYRLLTTSSDFELRSCKNSGSRIPEDQLGFLIYGNKLEVEKILRLQSKGKKKIRGTKSVSEDEIEMLVVKYRGKHLPEGYFFDGYGYRDQSGNGFAKHPNVDKLVEIYLDEINSEIADYNIRVQKEWKLYE